MPKDSIFSVPFSIYRLRLLIRPKNISRIAPQHSAMFYAILCDARAAANNSPPAMPDGVLLHAPDQAVTCISPARPISMGLSFLIGNGINPAQRLNQVIDGLRTLGRDKSKRGSIRQFTVDRIDDLNSKQTIQAAGQATPVSSEQFEQQFERLRMLDSVWLKFTMPLRCSRPKSKRSDGHSYFDESYFSARHFLNRLARRLVELGCTTAVPSPVPSAASIVRNELVWLDVGYGSKDRKTLGGVVGDCIFTGLSELEKQLLVLGQYVHVGENTRFGFGAYQLPDCGELAPICPRTTSLMQHAFQTADVDRIGAEVGLESGVLSQTIAAVQNGAYQPEPPYVVDIPKSSGGTRTLCIPTLRDRAIQRILLEGIEQSIDAFLESSSMAYRRGLGRDQAARQLRSYFRQGYGWAVKADFLSFFDNIDHELLRRRLSAYLRDPELVEFIMSCIQVGRSQFGKGIPTGSPLSPMIANLFLDHFDELIAAAPGKLVRYADDFLILCRSESDAQQLYQIALKQAEDLALELNKDKSATFQLKKGFDFLGFKFSLDGQWVFQSPQGPQLVEDLGWQASQGNSTSPEFLALPGESDWDSSLQNRSLIVGPTIARLVQQGRHLIFERHDKATIQRVALNRIRDVTIVGDATVDWRTLTELAKHSIAVRVIDATMCVRMDVQPPAAESDAKGVLAQADRAQQDSFRLAIARRLVASKLNNYAVLGQRYWKESRGRVREMFDLVESSLATESIEQLLGFEGRGAAIWYGHLSELLGGEFQFAARVAPDASDPINVLLNFAQTLLHRWMVQCVTSAGLVPTLGAMHRDRPGHATLASDLQEPFRHLMDRVVIESSRKLRVTDFMEDSEGPFPLRIQPRARVAFVAMVHRMLATAVCGYGRSEPNSYLQQGRLLAREYRSALLQPGFEFRSFWHPSPVAPRAWGD